MPIPSTITELRETEKLRALQLIRSLPSLGRTAIKDSELCCPICLISFETISEDEELVLSRQGSSQPASSSQPRGLDSLYGVVKLTVCGHAFCRKDIAEWVDSFHGSCPACRQVFFEFTPIDEAEYESSDGGEYLPDEDEFEEDEFFTDDDLILSSDFLDTDVEIDDEEEADVSFAYGERTGFAEALLTRSVDGSSVYADVSDAEPEGDDEMPRIEFLSDDFVPELDGGMSSENDASLYASEGLTTDGSTSLSSDGPSLEHNNDNDASEYAADVSMVSADVDVHEDCITNIGPIISKEQDSPSLDFSFAI